MHIILYLQHIKGTRERLTCRVMVVLLAPWSTDRCPPPALAHPPSEKSHKIMYEPRHQPSESQWKSVQFTNLPDCFFTLLYRNLIGFSLIFRHCKPQSHYKYSNSMFEKSTKHKYNSQILTVNLLRNQFVGKFVTKDLNYLFEQGTIRFN